MSFWIRNSRAIVKRKEAREALVVAAPAVRDTQYELALRHVREAEERVARQKLVVDRMSRCGDERVTRLSVELLATLRRSVAVAKQHLRLLEEQAERDILGDR